MNEISTLVQPRAEGDNRKGAIAVGNENRTPALDTFGRDISRLAQEGKLDSVIGRKAEINRVAQILSRRKKNNPILLGEPGVGKTAIAEGIALQIKEKSCAQCLWGKRIIALDLTALMAGASLMGEFERRIQAVMDEVRDNPDIILFVDEIHNIINTGGRVDAGNIMKPALARGELQLIGATTYSEYRENIEKDGALARRFCKVTVEEPSIAESIEMLKQSKSYYEKFHNVTYSDEIIESCVKLSARYITDRHLPDKAFDIMDEVGSKIKTTNYIYPKELSVIKDELDAVIADKHLAVAEQRFNEAADFRTKETSIKARYDAKKEEIEASQRTSPPKAVTDEDINQVVSIMTGIPVVKVHKTESTKLINMPTDLKGSVIGQDEAIEKVAISIQRSRVGLSDPNKPIGSFMFLGSTGVGKTQLAKTLAKYMFDTPDSLIRIDMSEYKESFTVSRLVGSPPGYVGYDQGGELTEKVRKRPYSVVLFDEIEKAHPDIYNILLQILDDGYLTDANGRRVDFRNTVIIMTSNIGVRQLQNFGTGVGFATQARLAVKEEAQKEVINKALKKSFAPEFLNRIDEFIFFNRLSKENLTQIIDIELNTGILDRLSAQDISLSVDDKVKDLIIEQGYDPQLGARPLKRAIQRLLDNEVCGYMLHNPGHKKLKATLDKTGKVVIKK